MTAHALDVGLDNFEQEVLEASKTVPVLVDFWAPWCGPCRALTPILEKLAGECGGRFRLAKINSDENPELSREFAIRSIPSVKAFVGGRLVDEFSGALPESAVRAFLARLLPSPGEELRRKAATLLAEGRIEEAIASLEQAIRIESGNDLARFDLADLRLQQGNIPQARQALAEVAPKNQSEERFRSLCAQIALLEESAAGPDEAALLAQVAAHPEDLEARFALAGRHVAAKRHEAALEQLLEIIQRNRNFKDDAARKTMLTVFDLAADQPDLVSRYRRLLASALH